MSSHTLLVADDSLAVQRLIALTFAGHDVSVITAGDGDEAVRMLDEAPPDIVLADIDMPGASGYDVADHMRRSATLAHVPVLLMASAFDPIEEGRAASVGAVAVLTKPIEPEALVRQVKDLIGGPRATAPAPRPVLLSAVPTPARTGNASALDDYFAQLDQAIAARVAVPAPPAVEPVVEVVSEAAVSQPSLASAFSAILDAEQNGGDEAVLADLMPPMAGAAPMVISDELVERIARRVIDHLSDQPLRDTLAEAVSQTAERLVTQEIERIKSNIK